MIQLSAARARLVVLGTLIVVVCAAWLIPGAVAVFGRDGTVTENSEAFRARHAAERLGAPPADLVLTVSGDEGAERTAEQAALAVSRALSREPGVRAVWSGGSREQPRAAGPAYP
ncbi:hypothetical protein [Streptomyces sp. NBRC 110035]|uniref:hypothetical protein n=1 Tax=Streptomyces sp. NBRC 110035 TaxID=1547867 RepID=UPI0006975E6A|nr:hypothetical protein [Streptomyces sp. NBRC 110035]